MLIDILMTKITRAVRMEGITTVDNITTTHTTIKTLKNRIRIEIPREACLRLQKKGEPFHSSKLRIWLWNS